MISAILLAAGQSKRMNGKNKLTKKIYGLPLIKHSIKNILNAPINELIIVVGHEKEIIKKLINNNKKIKIVFNKKFKSGMASSIKAGLRKLSKKTDAFFICLGDMPKINYYKRIIYWYELNLKFNKKLYLTKNKKEIFVPIYKKRQVNPILFTKSMKKKIMHISGDVGAKSLLKIYKKKIFRVCIDDFNLAKDFDKPNDFNI